MNIAELKQLVEAKYINVQQHPEADLFIYNYSQKTQFEGLWNDTTLACRGLILNKNNEIVARPFKKFFNFEEYQSAEIPKEEFDVYEKMDGSLGILYWVDNKPFIATRGSFASEQALWATTFLHQNFSSVFHLLNRNYTYLFEIIYPSNRIVVDYGQTEDLVLLGVIETAMGQDVALPLDLGFTVVKKYDGLTDYQQLKNFAADNFEGFVLKFKSGLRLKVKLEEYVRLHRILTNFSTLDIWECLAMGRSFDAFLEHVPDEFYEWVKATKAEIEGNFKQIEDECKAVFKAIEDRKEAAEYFKQQKYPMILFKMLDNRPYQQIIWKLVRPIFKKAFAKED
jgi:RNA ligase